MGPDIDRVGESCVNSVLRRALNLPVLQSNMSLISLHNSHLLGLQYSRFRSGCAGFGFGASKHCPAAAMSSVKELREARRRKILERGGDRLAYITGQAKKLPPAADQPQGASPPGESGLKSLSIAGDIRPSHEDPLPTSSPSYDVNDISEEPRQSLSSAAAEEETTPLLPPSLVPAPAPSTSQQQELVARVVSKPSSSLINYSALVKSIDHSVVVRGLLAVLIGVSLVTQWTFSKCGSQSYVLGWPVLLVVISDVTVVLGAVLLGLVKVASAPGKENGAGLAVFRDARVEQMLAFTSQLEGALDFGLLVTKASRGLVSDISLYLVTDICTVSIALYHQPTLCTYVSR